MWQSITMDGLGVRSVEMVAVLVVLTWVEHAQVEKVLVCRDSASVLDSVNFFHSRSRQSMLYEILKRVTRCVSQGSVVRSLWVPGHVGAG